ncbi:efflux RND transporter periplasmic adaptor subunit [Azospirillum sp. sgz301742]
MRPGLRRALAILAVGVPLLAGLAYAFRPRPVPVDLATVGRGAMTVTVDDEGWTRVRDLFGVSTPVAGQILRVAVRAGDPVKEGETAVATILPSAPSFLDLRSRAQAEAALDAANAALTLADAEVAKARAELDFARSDLERARTLAQTKTVSPRAFDLAVLEVKTREAALTTAEANRRVRQHQVATARAALIDPSGVGPGAPEGSAACCVTVRAPVTGRVLRVVTQSEGVVAAGTLIAEIGDVRDLEILVQLLSTEAVRISEGAPVRIEQWGGGTVLAGRVRRIEPYGFTKVSALGIEEQRVNVIVDFTDEHERWAALGHGYRVEVRIVVWQGGDVLTVPMGALFRDGGQWAVFVETQGRAHRRQVTLGWTNDAEAEVRGGLEPGERIVLHPSDRIVDGIRVAGRAVQAR